MTRRKMPSLLKHFLPSNQIVNLQMLHHPYLKVSVNQLSQKQTFSIRSMYKLASVKIFSWLRHCHNHPILDDYTFGTDYSKIG